MPEVWKHYEDRIVTKAFLVFTVLILAICLAVGCGKDIEIYTDPDKPIYTMVGEEFIISFQLDPPGCHWREHHDKDMLYLVEETYGPVQKGSNAVSFAGTQYFRYKSLKSGITHVTLTLFRLNEPDIAMEKVFKVNIKSTEPPQAQNTPRVSTNSEKIRVIKKALDTPEVSMWVKRERDYSMESVQWYALWPHEWMVFDYNDFKTDPNYKLVPESAVWYPGVTITFGKTTTHLTKFQFAVDLETEEVVWLFGPIEVDG